MANEDKHSHHDKATLDTTLGTDKFIERLANEIRRSPAPKSLSISGYWGAGKTSALALLFKQLTGTIPPGFDDGELLTGEAESANDEFTGIWFEAWRYQHEPVPIVALLHCIKKHFTMSATIFDKLGKFIDIAAVGAFTIFDNVIKTATGLSGFDKLAGVGEKYENDNLLRQLSSDQINEALSKAIDVVLNKGEESAAANASKAKKLVIFIDDLDRCEPATAAKLLEGLKLYFNLPNCIIIFALDQTQVEQILSHQAKGNLGIEQKNFYGVEYLEKLCQDTHRLPIPDQTQRNNFVIGKVKALLTELAGGFVLKGLKDELADFDCLPANPRRLKMLANRIASLYRITFKVKGKLLTAVQWPDGRYDLAVLVVAIFSVSYPNIYERLEASHEFINELAAYCEGASELGFDKQAFEGFIRPSAASTNTASSVSKHHNALEVFRLAIVFIELNAPEAGLDPELAPNRLYQFGLLLNNLIRVYNGKDIIPAKTGA